jgi:hypothetical protein
MANYCSKLKTMLKCDNFFPKQQKNIVKEGKCNKNEHNLGIMLVVMWFIIEHIVNQSSISQHFDFNYLWNVKVNCKARLGTP